MSGSISRRLTGLAALVLLSACQPARHEELLADYLTRVGRLVDRPAALAAPEPLPGYPAARTLRLPIERQTVNVGEFIELHRCDLGGLVGFRNSPLGRTQQASQRLGYEAAIIRAMRRCVRPLPPWLRDVLADKRARLPALYWNATFAADEFQRAMGASLPDTQGDLAFVLRSLADHLSDLERGELDVSAFEITLAALGQGSWAGPARQRWSLWRRYLDATAAVLDGADARLCRTGRPTPTARHLQNLFRRFYVERIQPELVRGMREHEAWIRELTRLGQRLRAIAPSAYRDWFAAVLDPHRASSEWRRTRAAVAAHARTWSEVLTGCGLPPGARPPAAAGIEPLPALGQH